MDRRSESAGATTPSFETKASRLRAQHSAKLVERIRSVNDRPAKSVKRFKNLPWTAKGFDVRAWEQSEKDNLLVPIAPCPEDVKRIIDGSRRGSGGQLRLPETPFKPKVDDY